MLLLNTMPAGIHDMAFGFETDHAEDALHQAAGHVTEDNEQNDQRADCRTSRVPGHRPRLQS